MTATPLISCIMPTANRRAFIAQALKLFASQDYPEKELIIVDDGEDRIEDLVPGDDPSVRYIAVSTPLTIGAKRNLAISLARGEIIAHFDDDDYYGPRRLSKQAAPIVAGEADISGLLMRDVVNLNDCTAYRCGPTLHNEIFAMGVHGGTLMYRKSLWGATAAFANISSGEDGGFLRLVVSQGAKLAKIDNAGDFVYMRLASLWPLPPCEYPHGHEWQRVKVSHCLPEADLAFYTSFRPT